MIGATVEVLIDESNQLQGMFFNKTNKKSTGVPITGSNSEQTITKTLHYFLCHHCYSVHLF